MSDTAIHHTPGTTSNASNCEVSDVFCSHGDRYRQEHALPLSHLKVMNAIEVCRTAYLGGHVEKCDNCGYEKNAYNSCRNRHCPKCQTLTKVQWLENRKSELLPVDNFHIVFTLPHELNQLVLCNTRLLFNILFKSVSKTLLEFGHNHLGGKVGFICILHTWDQTLLDHFHLHCVVAAGALSFDHKKWISAGKNYLFAVRALSKVFRGKYIHYLNIAFRNGELIFPGKTAPLGKKGNFSKLIDILWLKEWVVYSKKSFKNRESVLDYLGRYTHRVAISNNRLVALNNGKVTFRYKDRRNRKVKNKVMTLNADEFIRRFLLHVLPDNFMRIRHFGFSANRCKKDSLQRCFEFFDVKPHKTEIPDQTTRDIMLDLTGIDITLCPCCKKGKLRTVKIIIPEWEYRRDSYFNDTS